ncbi:hypothetical protein EV360DRAFT_87539 [Lentinula raphanica]|nr:hypothetical protein EV360DRAFT_87539 [Lentinula raphanica]
MSTQRPPGRTDESSRALGGECPRQLTFEGTHYVSNEPVDESFVLGRNCPNAHDRPFKDTASGSPSFSCSDADIFGGTLSAIGGSQNIHDAHNRIGVLNIYKGDTHHYTFIDYKAAIVIGLFARGDFKGLSCA